MRRIRLGVESGSSEYSVLSPDGEQLYRGREFILRIGAIAIAIGVYRRS